MKRMLLVLLVTVVGCGPTARNNGDDTGGGDAPMADAACPTAITGKVYAPNGTLPLYNITVYAPISDPPPFTPGVSCSQCAGGLPGGSYAETHTDAQGNFRLEGIPPGQNVPVIITSGKWRRKIIVPDVPECQDTSVVDGTFRLPKNRTEGELPRIAMVTGGCDPLGCILSKLGIDATEFSDNWASGKSVVFYNGSGGTSPGASQPSTALWGSLAELMKYDVVINSCECSEHNENKTAPDLLRQYADMGGRVFGSHYHYTWTRTLIPQWQGTATWSGGGGGTPDLVDMSHAGGMALAQWLVTVGASTVLGQIQLGAKTNDAGPVMTPTTRWLYASGASPASHYLSFQTPVGTNPNQQCGKVVYAGMHVASGSVSASFPSGCTGALTPDEKALVFLLFDLTTCVGSIF